MTSKTVAEAVATLDKHIATYRRPIERGTHRNEVRIENARLTLESAAGQIKTIAEEGCPLNCVEESIHRAHLVEDVLGSIIESLEQARADLRSGAAYMERISAQLHALEDAKDAINGTLV